MIKNCEICGKEFETKRDYQKYCSKACRLKQNRSLERERTEKKRTERKTKNKSLTNAAVEARAMGMTYGQYQAMKTIEMLRGE